MKQNRFAPGAPATEAEADEPASREILDFDPVPLRYREDGLTPEKQREYVEALADCGIARHAAALVGITEQAVNRVRRRPDARAFDRACAAALRIGARRLVSVAFERAIEGTIKRHTYHGEIVSEERVYDNRLLMALVGKLPNLFEEGADEVERAWQPWMEAVEQGLPEPPPPPAPAPQPVIAEEPEEDEWTGNEVWEQDGQWWTSFPPPAGFDGQEGKAAFGFGYARTLSPEELAVIEAEEAAERAEEVARRDRYFGFAGGEEEAWACDEWEDEVFPPRGCETYETSAEPAGDSGAIGERAVPEAQTPVTRHCEECSDEAIQTATEAVLDCFACARNDEGVCARNDEGTDPASNPAPPSLQPRLPEALDEDVTLYARFAAHIDAILDALEAEGRLAPGVDRKAVAVEPPRDPAHGDLATNAAMVLAKGAGTNPRALAGLIAPGLEALDEVESVEVAGPGFINIRLGRGVWEEELAAILVDGEAYGRSDMGSGARVNVEYVSANPTGPMHMGHCRGAVVGDALASLLEYAGHQVTREYYVNDAGGQVDVLARSAHLRYREALGEHIEIPEGLYPGDYLVPVGRKLAAEHGDRFVGRPESEWLALFREEAVAAMMAMIRDDLALLGIHHDIFSSEAELQAAGKPEAAEKWLRERGLVYDGMLEAPKGETPEDWEPVELPLFRATQFGDDQDRPIRKSDGSWTYFGADLAYHFEKAQRSDQLIDIWGADHAGTVKRIKAAVAALTEGRTPFDIKIVQMVRLLRAGEPVKMSKRAGNFVTLADVVREVGKDVVRFTMLTRKADAQMDFDFAKVVEASKDNPVFYVQYAHARISSLKRKAAAEGVDLSAPADLSLLDEEELALVRLGAQFPRVVESAAAAHEPHRIAFYLYDLAGAFHALWNKGNDDPERRFLLAGNPALTRARLELAAGIGQIIRNGLAIMGVAAAEEMQ